MSKPIELYDTGDAAHWDVAGNDFFTTWAPALVEPSPEAVVDRLLLTADGGGWGDTKWSVCGADWILSLIHI